VAGVPPATCRSSSDPGGPILVVGFTRCEAVAERYEGHKLVIDGRVLTVPVVSFSG